MILSKAQWALAVSCAFLFASFSHAGEAKPALVRNGVGQAEIVLGDKPARMAKFAARELQTYVEKISGAKLPIVTDPSASPGVTPIYVGKSRFTDQLNLKTDGLKYGAYRMASGPNWLALLGPDRDYVPIEPWGRSKSPEETVRVNEEWDKITGDTFWNNFREVFARYHKDLDVWDYDDAGTLNATYEFLRSLGVRWYAPGETGEVVPKSADIALPAEFNKTVQPDFPLRRLSFFYEFMDLPKLDLWTLRLGCYRGQDLIGMTQPAHGMKFVLMREEMKKAHPEYYSLHNGERATEHKGAGAPSLRAPGLQEKHLKYARAVFDHFKEPMISIDVVDGFSARISDEDKHLATPDRGWAGSMSDYVWGYMNEVALDLYKTHPDRMVSGLAYGAYQLPPEQIQTMSPNLAIIECRWRSNFHDKAIQQKHRELRNAWLAKLPSKMYFTWDYYIHNRPRETGFPVYFPHLISEDLRELKGVSMGDLIEVYNHQPGTEEKMGYDEFAVNHLNLYITSRLWWNADQNVDALLDEYYALYYGPARAEMKAFIEFSEANSMLMKSDPAKILQAQELLASALQAAPAGSIYAKRIEAVVTYMEPLKKLSEQMAKKKESDLTFRVLVTNKEGGGDMRKKPLDGKLDKEFWPPVRVTGLNALEGSSTAGAATTFQVLRLGEVLYFGIRCNDADMANLNIPTTVNGDPRILEGDHVTILLETNTHSYYEIAVNPAGAVYEFDHGNPDVGAKWSSASAIAVHRGEGFWSVELRVPVAGEGASALDATKGIDGSNPRELFPWHFNIVRQRVRDAKVQRLAYAVPKGESKINDPVTFAKMWGK